jgi:hypothetical protein
MPPKKRYQGYVARGLKEAHTYPVGTPPPTTEQLLELTKIEASVLAERMEAIPIHYEHEDQLVSVGKVTAAWLDQDDLLAEFELDDADSNASAGLVGNAVDNFKFNCLSLTHAPASMIPLELSIVAKGARPGTVLVNRPGQEDYLAAQMSKLKISASSAKLKPQIYKTTWTCNSVIRASDRTTNNKMADHLVINNQGLNHLLSNPSQEEELKKLLPPNGAHPFSSPAEEEKKRRDAETAKKVSEHDLKMKKMEDELSIYKSILSSVMPGNMQQQIMPPQPNFHQQLMQQTGAYIPGNNFNPNPYVPAVQASNQIQQPNQQQQQQQPNNINYNNNQQQQQQQQPAPVNNNNNNNTGASPMDVDFNKAILAAAEAIVKPQNGIQNDQEKAMSLRVINQLATKEKQAQTELDKLRKELEQKDKQLELEKKDKADLVQTYSSVVETSMPGADPEVLKQMREAAVSRDQQKFHEQTLKLTASAAAQNQQQQYQLKAMQAYMQQQQQQQQQMQQHSLAQNEYNQLAAMFATNTGFNNNYSVSASSQNFNNNNNNGQQPSIAQLDSYQQKVIRASSNVYQKQNQNGRSNTISDDRTWCRLPYPENAYVHTVLNASNIGTEDSDKWHKKLVQAGADALNPNVKFGAHHDFHPGLFMN